MGENVNDYKFMDRVFEGKRKTWQNGRSGDHNIKTDLKEIG